MRRPTQLSIDRWSCVLCQRMQWILRMLVVVLCSKNFSALSMDGSASGSSLTHHMSETLLVLYSPVGYRWTANVPCDVTEFQYRFMSRWLQINERNSFGKNTSECPSDIACELLGAATKFANFLDDQVNRTATDNRIRDPTIIEHKPQSMLHDTTMKRWQGKPRDLPTPPLLYNRSIVDASTK